jgi:hypothetical protein
MCVCVCVCDTGCAWYGQDEISCPTSHLPPSTVAMESIVLVSAYYGYRLHISIVCLTLV